MLPGYQKINHTVLPHLRSLSHAFSLGLFPPLSLSFRYALSLSECFLLFDFVFRFLISLFNSFDYNLVSYSRVYLPSCVYAYRVYAIKIRVFFFKKILYCFIIWVSFYFNKKWKFFACYSFWFLLRAIWAVSMSNCLVYLFYLSKKLSGSVFFYQKIIWVCFDFVEHLLVVSIFA